MVAKYRPFRSKNSSRKQEGTKYSEIQDKSNIVKSPEQITEMARKYQQDGRRMAKKEFIAS